MVGQTQAVFRDHRDARRHQPAADYLGLGVGPSQNGHPGRPQPGQKIAFQKLQAGLPGGLGLGIAGTYTSQTGTPAQTLLPTYRTPAQSPFFRFRTGMTPTLADGERTRIAPQFHYYVGRFGLLGEYTTVSQDVSRRISATSLREDSLDTTAWQLQAAWFLTGEEESFRGFKPNNVFSLANNTWGAFELVARYHELDPDDDAFVGGAASFADPAVSARKATAYGLGLNWYLNENLKWVLNYEQTSFDGGAPAGADRDDEKVFLTRFALGF